MPETTEQPKTPPEIRRAVGFSLIVVAASTSALQALFGIAPVGWDILWKIFNAQIFAIQMPGAEEGARNAALVGVILLGGLVSWEFGQKAILEIEKALPEIRTKFFKVGGEIEKHAAVVAALSYVAPPDGSEPNRRKVHEQILARTPTSPQDVLDLVEELRQKSRKGEYLWQQHPFLHVVYAWSHHFVLRNGELFVPPLYILTSKRSGDIEGSDDLFDDFKAFCGAILGFYQGGGRANKGYGGHSIDELVIRDDNCVNLNFENFDDVRRALEDVCETIAPEKIKQIKNKIPEEVSVLKPVIDVTGGQRTVAIAAASITLQFGMPGFTYVSQDTNDLKYYKLVAYEQRVVSTG